MQKYGVIVVHNVGIDIGIPVIDKSCCGDL